MPLTLAQKILKAHLVEGDLTSPQIGVHIDQTLTQDATGTMAYLELEAMDVERVRTERSTAYIDHNTLQSGFENADDHRYIRTVASKYGVRYSRPGNGICHQVQLERYAIPGKTLIGSDSHTPTAGGVGCLAFGAGGLDVAVAMGGGAYYIANPKMVRVELTGCLAPWVAAKDVILEVLRRLTVKGGVGKIIEYTGSGVASLTVPQRATITNMGAELGATTSIFPSDEMTRAFLRAQGREDDWTPLAADADAVYDESYTVDLSELEPLAACPHSPDNVKHVSVLTDVKVDQCCIGSCTNSSYADMMTVAAILKGKTIAPMVSLTISPGSKQVYSMLAANGALADLINAGARVLECACGPCIGMGQSPNSAGVSLRTFNRNFLGRSGTADAQVYLVSPEVAAASALTGYITDPRTLGEAPVVTLPDVFPVCDNLVDEPSFGGEVLRGPNIKPFPLAEPLAASLECKVALKVGDNITTDHIMPAGAKILPFRSNVPHLSRFCFAVCDPEFPERAKALGCSFIVGGANYGQGSSREHAALVPLYLGVRAVVVKSFARIHKANLINTGILPLTFADEADYDRIAEGDVLALSDVAASVAAGEAIVCENRTKGERYTLHADLSPRDRAILAAGGLIRYTKGE